MKKVLIFTLTLFLISCENEAVFKLDPNAKIYIKPAENGWVNEAQKVKSNSEHLSALEIVKQATIISTPDFERSFIAEQRDSLSTPPKLLMWATDVLTESGLLQTKDNTGYVGFIDTKDVVFVRYSTHSWEPNNVIDTIAYIPNSTLRAAETAIRAAFEAKDIDECYRVFNEAYTFRPITGAEWRALKDKGEN